VIALERLGIQWAASITSGDTPAAKQRKLEEFQTGSIRLLYVSPERIRIRSFAIDLLKKAKSASVGALIIDEVHCLSEWGHDFRPAISRYRDFERRSKGCREG